MYHAQRRAAPPVLGGRAEAARARVYVFLPGLLRLCGELADDPLFTQFCHVTQKSEQTELQSSFRSFARECPRPPAPARSGMKGVV